MHLLETYSLNCGAKIDRPFIYESYFPNPIENYILIQTETQFDSRNYSFWQDVIDIVFPI